MKLKHKYFVLCSDILKFVENEEIDVNDIISISSQGNMPRHHLWWKEGEKDRGCLKHIEGLLRNGALPYLENGQVRDAIRCVEEVLSSIIDEVKNDI